jgi:ketosteroid isomerase-like protein
MAEEPCDSNAIRRLLGRLATTANCSDLDGWSQIWDEDAKLFAPQTPPIVGRADIILGNRKWLLQFQHEMCLDCDEVQVAGLWAFAFGNVTLRSTHRKAGTTSYTNSKFLAIVRKRREQQWRLYLYCHNSNVPPPAPSGR